MATLTIHQGHLTRTIAFDAPAKLTTLLAAGECALGQPCGGHGICGKCAVELTGDVSLPNQAEIQCGVRLACQATVYGDAIVSLPAPLPLTQIEGGRSTDLYPSCPMQGRYGAAVDVGTTTLALLLYDLHSGQCIGSANMLNPQTSISGDVIGRIDAAMHGQAQHLRQQVEGAIATLLTSACAHAGLAPADIESMVVTGNTTMLYLLAGLHTGSLSKAPFNADHLFGETISFLERTAYLPDCMHAFVGADTACAILASGMLERDETALLCDVGTNGELALWHHSKLYIAATAAGPAFEGAGISCGCSSVPGAIDWAEVINEAIICHTIGDIKAVGICGSGLVDVTAAMLDTGKLDDTGYLEDAPFPLPDGLSLSQGDIRAVQLAKAATCAGILTLLSAAGCPVESVSVLYLAGGFGSHLNIQNTVRIGMIPPALADKVQVVGNAALEGASMLLMDISLREKVACMRKTAQHIRLDGNAEFSEHYVYAMLFP